MHQEELLEVHRQLDALVREDVLARTKFKMYR